MPNLHSPSRRGAATSALPALALPALLLAGLSSGCAIVPAQAQVGENRPVDIIEDNFFDEDSDLFFDDEFDRSSPVVMAEGSYEDSESPVRLVDEADEYDEYDESRPIVGEGGRVVGFSGSYSYSDNRREESETFVARATIDEYLTDNHVIGAYVLAQFRNVESDSFGEEEYWAGLHYHYHYHLSRKTSIFAGPSIGVATFDDDLRSDTSLTYGVSGGIRHWLTKRAAFTVEPTYLFTNQDSGAGGDTRQVLVLWGLAFSL